MKSCAWAVVCSLAFCAAIPLLQASEKDQPRTAASPTRISEDVARSVASERFPDSAFERSDLEKEHGRLIWSIQLRPHGSNAVREVHIDALSGEIVATEVETDSQDDEPDREDERQRDH